MSAETKIEWARHTFNPWWGCARISPGCVHCYADTIATRWGHELWRRHGPRRAMSDQYWQKPLIWNRKAAEADGPVRVFCASMADVFEDHPESDVWAFQDKERARLWDLIEATPNLTWMLLTKRPQNVAGMVPWGEDWPSTVWLGASVEDQRRADERMPILLDIPAAVRFVSAEPLVGPVSLWDLGLETGAGPEWVICGGESGAKARPMHAGWARSLRDQCRRAGPRVPFHFKQHGAWAPVVPDEWQNRKSSDWLIRHDGKAWPLAEPHGAADGTEVTIRRTGKKAAGRELDGRTHDECPAAVSR